MASIGWIAPSAEPHDRALPLLRLYDGESTILAFAPWPVAVVVCCGAYALLLSYASVHMVAELTLVNAYCRLEAGSF